MRRYSSHLLLVVAIWILGLLSSPIGVIVPPKAQAATTISVDIRASDDAGAIESVPTAVVSAAYLVVNQRGGGDFDHNYVLFDLSTLPANATITSASFRINTFLANGVPVDVELGRANGPWDETTLSWNSKPSATWSGILRTITQVGNVSWDVTPIVQSWYDGTQPNYGLVFRGTNGNGGTVLVNAKETGPAPALQVVYSLPSEEGPRPDFGDAPDSTNHAGIPNTAYPGIAGNFPSVWAGTPLGQAAGPHHQNVTVEGLLGDYISRETDADLLPDGDGRTNILDGGADNRNNDRGDDGWLNQTTTFDDCEPTTLQVRVRKSPTATLNRMYLNVWFDGSRDGDWSDRQPCTPQGAALQIPSDEWIVQNYVVDLASIAAGGFADIAITTETVLNSVADKGHWVRFTLSEQRLTNANGQRPDGRGPNPNETPNAFAYGETEDYLYRPQAAGTPGTLELTKQVLADQQPTEWIDYVTYKISLRHVGGSEPQRATIIDTLPYPLIVYPTINNGQISYVQVESPQNGAAPLTASLDLIPPDGVNPPRQQVRWQGTLAPNSQVDLTFQVRVIALCEANQQTMTFTNLAEARPRGGAVISDQVNFTAKCLDYEESNIEVEVGGTLIDSIDPHQVELYPWGASMRNNHPFSVTLGLVQLPDISNAAIALPSFLKRVTLEPNQQIDVEAFLALDPQIADDLASDSIEQYPLRVAYCLLVDERNECPDRERYPQLWGDTRPITVTLRPNDLGDAPDSSNHAAVAMLAYPGVQAAFPTVFDPATGLPPGPRHANPRPFHLGQQVSHEGEADAGSDQDPTNNILPAANQPNRDGFDDGTLLSQWQLSHCQSSTIPVKVAITPAAWNWFSQQQQPGYLNAWIDSNRDGDWADGSFCGGGVDGGGNPAVEHIVIDFPVDVIALGPGMHTINMPTGLVPWPSALADQPSWLRLTLSEQPANKPLQFGGVTYGDGRGYAQAFRTGETEDYLLRATTDPAVGPDLAVHVRGRALLDQGSLIETSSFRVHYANQGDRPAVGATLTFTIPTQLQIFGNINVTAPGVDPTAINISNGVVSMPLPEIAPGAEGRATIVIASSRDLIPAGDYLVSASIQLNSDTDLGNNSASTTIARPVPATSIFLLAGNETLWSRGDTTCRSDVTVVGASTPDQLFELFIDGTSQFAAISSDVVWSAPLIGLSDGVHELMVEPVGTSGLESSVQLKVDTSLPIDPISLTFTDTQGRVFHPSTIDWGTQAMRVPAAIIPGEPYTVEIDSCIEDLNQSIDIVLGNGTLLTFTDPDGDGRYGVVLVFDESGSIDSSSFQALQQPMLHTNSPRSMAMQMRVVSGGATQHYTSTLDLQADGHVIDRQSGLPLARASVTVLAGNASGNSLFGPLPAAALGQANPQSSASDGSYRFASSHAGQYLTIAKSGYQPFRSWPIAADESLNQTIVLTPQIAQQPSSIVELNASGFSQSFVVLAPGSVIEWVNTDLSDHGVAGDGIASGALASGEHYRLQLTTPGRYIISDPANPTNTMTIEVRGYQIALPLVTR
ncbi:MAG: hypothetical protein OHK0050_22220 [Roseiflexaceae bacterium]